MWFLVYKNFYFICKTMSFNLTSYIEPEFICLNWSLFPDLVAFLIFIAWEHILSWSRPQETGKLIVMLDMSSWALTRGFLAQERWPVTQGSSHSCPTFSSSSSLLFLLPLSTSSWSSLPGDFFLNKTLELHYFSLFSPDTFSLPLLVVPCWLSGEARKSFMKHSWMKSRRFMNDVGNQTRHSSLLPECG